MDLTQPITISSFIILAMAMLGATIKIILYFLDAKLARYDKHLEQCQEKSINHARLEEKVIRIEGKMDDMKEVMMMRTGKIDRMDEKIDALANVIIAKRSIQA